MATPSSSLTPYCTPQQFVDRVDVRSVGQLLQDVTGQPPLTPHVASMTQPETAAAILLENIRRHQRGEPLKDVIDRSRGY